MLVSDRLQVANAAAVYQTRAIERAALANTNLSIANIRSNLTSTNTALRTLINDRMQVANAATKVNPTTSGLLAHTGRATISTNLTVSGNTTFGAAAKTTGITGLLTVTGRQTIDNNLTVSGNTTLGGAGKTITTTGLLAHTGRATISTNLTVSGNTTLGGAAKTTTITGLATITGRQTISTNLYVSGNTVLGDPSAAAERTTINGTLFANSNLTVSGNTVIGSSAASTLTLTGNTIAITPAVLNFSSGKLFIQKNASRIGVNTVTPNTTLDVAGIVRSSTGGFRYPDGATTAAPIYIYDSSGAQVYP
jgi:hypothetical protein